MPLVHSSNIDNDNPSKTVIRPKKSRVVIGAKKMADVTTDWSSLRNVSSRSNAMKACNILSS